MILQLNPALPMDTPKGPADCHFIIDYGSEANLLFVTFLRHSGKCWTWPGPEIELEKNVTGGIRSCPECDNLKMKLDEKSDECDGLYASDEGLHQSLAEAREKLHEALQEIVDLRKQVAENMPQPPEPPKLTTFAYDVGEQVHLDGDENVTYRVDRINEDGTYSIRSMDGITGVAAADRSRLSIPIPF